MRDEGYSSLDARDSKKTTLLKILSSGRERQGASRGAEACAKKGGETKVIMVEDQK